MRSKVRQAALLALFALAVQFVLSFGHFHSNGIAHAAALTGQHQTTAPLSPQHQHPDGLAADSCAICASIALSGTLIASAPPTLPSSPSFAIAAVAVTSNFSLPDLTRRAFRSRAPPLS